MKLNVKTNRRRKYIILQSFKSQKTPQKQNKEKVQISLWQLSVLHTSKICFFFLFGCIVFDCLLYMTVSLKYQLSLEGIERHFRLF